MNSFLITWRRRQFLRTVPVNEGAVLLTERIGNAAGPGDRPTAKKKRQTEQWSFEL